MLSWIPTAVAVQGAPTWELPNLCQTLHEFGNKTGFSQARFWRGKENGCFGGGRGEGFLLVLARKARNSVWLLFILVLITTFFYLTFPWCLNLAILKFHMVWCPCYTETIVRDPRNLLFLQIRNDTAKLVSYQV